MCLCLNSLSQASRYDVFDVTQEDVYDDDEEVDDLNEFCTDPEQIHELWGKIVDDKDGLEFRDHRFRFCSNFVHHCSHHHHKVCFFRS